MDSRHTHKQIGTINTADGSRNVICFVGHCTHQIQPVGVAFMGPLNNYYSRDVKTWLRNNTGREVTQLTCLCSGSNPERRTFCVYTHRNLSRRHQSCCDTNFLESETTQWPTLSPPPQLGTSLNDHSVEGFGRPPPPRGGGGVDIIFWNGTYPHSASHDQTQHGRKSKLAV
jgi:hypothetical protein